MKLLYITIIYYTLDYLHSFYHPIYCYLHFQHLLMLFKLNLILPKIAILFYWIIVYWLMPLLLEIFYFLWTWIKSRALPFFSIYLKDFFACHKHRYCSSLLFRIEMLLVYLFHDLFWYFNFTFLCYLMLISLFNRVVNELLC